MKFVIKVATVIITAFKMRTSLPASYMVSAKLIQHRDAVNRNSIYIYIKTRL